MNKRSYRKIPIKQFQLEAITAAMPAGRVVFAIDVAKVDMVAAFANGRGEPIRFVTWKNPTENDQVLSLLDALRAQGYEV